MARAGVKVGGAGRPQGGYSEPSAAAAPGELGAGLRPAQRDGAAALGEDLLERGHAALT